MRAATLLVALVLLAAAGCGGGETTEPPGADREAAWLGTLGELGLAASQRAVVVQVSGDAPTLTVTITVPADAPGQVAFADALYGALAYAYEDGTWARVDTAEVRADVAPLLDPGQTATTELPVVEADTYRVLVPVAGTAAWADR